MIITRQDIANLLIDYLNHSIDLYFLTDTCEKWLNLAELEENQEDVLMEVLSKLGLADVKAFGLAIQDIENMFQLLGYKLDLKPEYSKAA
jgi:hypothetical protein